MSASFKLVAASNSRQHPLRIALQRESSLVISLAYFRLTYPAIIRRVKVQPIFLIPERSRERAGSWTEPARLYLSTSIPSSCYSPRSS
jgi:hypothetical protein